MNSAVPSGKGAEVLEVVIKWTGITGTAVGWFMFAPPGNGAEPAKADTAGDWAAGANPKRRGADCSRAA